MSTQQYIWKNGDVIHWQDAHTHVLTHALHYGSAVFEGIRYYQTQQGPAIFKLQEHIARFFYSAKQLDMRIPYSESDLAEAVQHIVMKNTATEGYIRPLAYYGYGSMKVVPDANLPVDVVIACWPWGEYLPVPAVDVAVSRYIRIHPQSTVPDAKISGHYINSILAGLAIKNTHYHEALLLDADGFVAEGSAENIFIVKHGKLITTPPGTILVGITRNTVFKIASEMGLSVEEKKFTVNDIQEADEAFFTGTAVEVTAIRSLDDIRIADGNIGIVTDKIKSRYADIVRGKAPVFFDDLTFVSNQQEDAA